MISATQAGCAVQNEGKEAADGGVVLSAETIGLDSCSV